MDENRQHAERQRGPASGPLADYRGRRHFGRTAEPGGGSGPGGGPLAGGAAGAEGGPEGGAAPRFVVQIHDARRMHFDFRLEVDGVLRSWAVPKGPSGDPRDKRLAVPTEDHPLEYRTFEGVIPHGEYGGGTVIVWDQGTYRPLSHDKRGHPLAFDQALEHGHATFWLEGDKLHGEYALTRFRTGGRGEEAWLLIKAKDRATRPGEHSTPDPHRARSARTGRTLRQVAEQQG